jgi:non-heme chloroperoxidase
VGYYIKVAPNIVNYVEDIKPTGKKTILFLHGWPANHKMFEYQFTYLAQQGIRCVGIDFRGFGLSDKPLEGYDYDTLADDIRSVIEALELQNITLAGHSTGGAIAIRYMARHNGFGVSKLALLASAAPSLIQRPYFPFGLKKEDVEKIIQGTYQDRPDMLREFGNQFFFQNLTEPFKEWFFQLGLQAANWATAAVANSWLNEEGLFNDLGKIQVPTLILHGIHDRVCLFPLAEAQRQGIKNSKLIPFQFSGHGLFKDEKDKVNEELLKFI